MIENVLENEKDNIKSNKQISIYRNVYAWKNMIDVSKVCNRSYKIK